MIKLSATIVTLTALIVFTSEISTSGQDFHSFLQTKTNHEKIPISRTASEVPLVQTADPSLSVNPHIPTHNFWPLVPVIGDHSNISSRIDKAARMVGLWKKLPSHNFWPWIPLKGSGYAGVWKNRTRLVHIPEHSFWPLVPVPSSRSRPGHKDKKIPSPTQFPPLPLPWPPSTHRYNYGEVLYKSILFYEVQRSGRLPRDRKILWRGDSAVDDRGVLGEDLSGGWYDSGDYVKFGLPMASSVTMLLWGLVTFPQAYVSVDLLDDVRDSVKWPLDYFIKAHTDKYSFYGQVGDPYRDHAYWGRPEEMDMERPAYILTPERPGSDLVGESSAAMAAGYLAFRDVDPLYAETLLTHAQTLFEFAESFRGVYSDSIPNAAEFYKSSRDEDELAWAAAWLYKATGQRRYLSKAVQWLARAPACWAQSWADKTCGATVLLYELTKDSSLKSNVEEIFQTWLPGGGIQYTPKGLAYRSPWGALRYTANMAMVALAAAEAGVNSDLYRRWALGQIHYMLGDGGRSYVIGFGKDPPTRPHHASSSCRPPPYPCNWDDYAKSEANAYTLYGALVGGPDTRDRFHDDREDYIHNEVGCEYNGGFQSAVAGLRHLELNRM